MPAHRESGICKYADFYPDGGCDWCAAADARAAETAPAEPNPNVLILTHRWQHAAPEESPARARRIA